MKNLWTQYIRSTFAIFCLKIGVTIFHWLFGIKVFSFFKRLNQQPKFPVSLYTSIADLLLFTKKFEWTADGDIGISDPGYVQWIGQDGNEHVGDCDEFAGYTSTAIQLSLNFGLMKEENIAKVYIAELGWVRDDGTVEGHAICVFTKTNGTYSWMDYDMPHDHYSNLQDIIPDILSIYAGPNAKGILMTLLSPELIPQKVIWA